MCEKMDLADAIFREFSDTRLSEVLVLINMQLNSIISSFRNDEFNLGSES